MIRCLVMFLVLLLPILARGGDAESVRLRSVQAEFTQIKHLKILTRPLVSQGMLLFQAPQSLRWEYRVPLHSVMLMHEGRLQKLVERNGRFEPDHGAGVDTMGIVLQNIGNWLDGRLTDSPLFTVSRTGAQDLVLTPKEPGLRTVISRIELHLGTQEGVVDRVTIVEGENAFTELTFSQVVLNREIPVQRFVVP